MPQPAIDSLLIRALREGASALPDDLDGLRSMLETIAGLLEEKAGEVEPSRELAEAAAAEIETLLKLEDTAAEKAVLVPAASLVGVLTKFAIWRVLAAESEGDVALSPRDRLVLSISRDLERMLRDGTGTGVRR